MRTILGLESSLRFLTGGVQDSVGTLSLVSEENQAQRGEGAGLKPSRVNHDFCGLVPSRPLPVAFRPLGEEGQK